MLTPAEAAEGTVRKLYAESKGRNAIHASGASAPSSSSSASSSSTVFGGMVGRKGSDNGNNSNLQ